MMCDFFIVAAHPDDGEVQMGGTIAKLTRAGQRALIVDLCDGEPGCVSNCIPGALKSVTIRDVAQRKRRVTAEVYKLGEGQR